MTSISRTAMIVALVGGLAACGGGSGAENQSNMAEAEIETGNMAETQAAGPFSEAEQRMNEAMMAAVGTDAADSWAKKMIAHHQGAIEMSQVALQQNPRADVAEMARMTIEKQGKEIEDLRKLLGDGAPNPQSAELYRPAMMDMHQKMMAVTGADVSETFMRKMHEHHKGGVAMSDIALRNGASGTLRQQIQKTRDDQQKEALMVEAMLRGEPMQSAMKQSGAKPAEQAKAEPASAPAPAATAKAEPKSQPRSTSTATPAAPKSTSTPPAKAEPAAPNSTCLPEHRAAGHC